MELQNEVEATKERIWSLEDPTFERDGSLFLIKNEEYL